MTEPSTVAAGRAPGTVAPMLAAPVEVTIGAAAKALAEVRAGDGSLVRVYATVPAEVREIWRSSLAHECSDHRYYDVLRETITKRFEHLYLVMSDATGRVRAVQPAFLVREDLLAGTPKNLTWMVNGARKVSKHLLMPKMLMVGNVAGEGAIAGGVTEDGAWVAAKLAETLPRIAKKLRAGIVVVKEMPKKYRGMLTPAFTSRGFARVASMPGSDLELNFTSFDDYCEKMLSRNRRQDLRKKFRRAEKAGKIELEVVSDITPYIDEAYALYRNVYEKAKLKFEKLTPAYMLELSKRMPERMRFFIWRLNGKMVAFNLCMVHDGVIKDNYIGLDYAVALDLNLYFLSWRDIVSWAIANGYKTYWTAALSYDPKLALRMKLAPLDLYVRHRSGLINLVFARVIKLFGPTRFDPTLKKFPNWGELEGEGAVGEGKQAIGDEGSDE